MHPLGFWNTSLTTVALPVSWLASEEPGSHQACPYNKKKTEQTENQQCFLYIHQGIEVARKTIASKMGTNRLIQRIIAYWRRNRGAKISMGTSTRVGNPKLTDELQEAQCGQARELKTLRWPHLGWGRAYLPGFYLQDF